MRDDMLRSCAGSQSLGKLNRVKEKNGIVDLGYAINWPMVTSPDQDLFWGCAIVCFTIFQLSLLVCGFSLKLMLPWPNKV